MDTSDCPDLTQNVNSLCNTTQLIPEISSLLRLTSAQVARCRQVVLTQISGDVIQGTPIGGPVPCGVQQTY